MKIRYLLLLFAAVISLALSNQWQPVRAASPEPSGYRNVTLWVNPEYDDPGLLVMLEGKITGVEPPAQVRFLVPSSASMYSAGSMDAQHKYSGGPPDRVPSSIPGWDEVSYTVTSDTFRIEYYDSSAITGQPDKKISYDFRWLFPISDLSVAIQRPRTATDFSIEPGGRAGTDGDGLAIQSFSYQDLSINDSPLHYDIAYTKTDSNVSVTNPALNSSSPSGASGSDTTQLILVVLAGIAVLGGALWIFKSMNTSRRPVKYAPGRGTVKTAKGKRRGDRFCRNCGKQIQDSDKFCPGCGNRVS